MEISSKPKNYNSMSPAPQNPPPSYTTVTPEYPTLIVMIAVLAIILLFCFWGAPGVRDYCRRSICCHCPMDQQPRETSGTPADDRSSTPTIILLPFGRMLVVDRNVFTQLQVDQTGIDFMELSANLIRAHHLQCGSTPSILDSDTTSKGISPTSLGFSPPSYDDIFGEKTCDLPPSYSELSFMFRQRQGESAIVIDADGNELQCFRVASETQIDEKVDRTCASPEEETANCTVSYENEKGISPQCNASLETHREEEEKEDNIAGCSRKPEAEPLRPNSAPRMCQETDDGGECDLKRHGRQRSEDVKESSL